MRWNVEEMVSKRIEILFPAPSISTKISYNARRESRFIESKERESQPFFPIRARMTVVLRYFVGLFLSDCGAMSGSSLQPGREPRRISCEGNEMANRVARSSPLPPSLRWRIFVSRGKNSAAQRASPGLDVTLCRESGYARNNARPL